MNGPDSYRILLIHPPVVSPTMYPWALAYTGSCIASWGISLHYYDANLDFFLNHILASKLLAAFLKSVKEKKKQGVFNHAPIKVRSLANDILMNREKWNETISTIDFNLKRLRTGEFYKPEKYISAITDINDLLMLVSLAFYPSCIHWNGFSNPDVENLRNIHKFVDDRDTNPFLALCENSLAGRIACKELKLLLILVPSPGQTAAALTLARHSKRLRPDLHIAIMGNHELFRTSGYVDSFLRERDLKELVTKIIPSSGDGLEECISIPNFSGLPLRDYVYPDIVLHIELSEDVMLPSHTILRLVQTYKRRFAPTVFLNRDTYLPIAFIKKLAEDPTTDKQSVLICLTCTLDGLADSTNMDDVYRAGVRLIHWQASSQESKALTRILWHASKAGVWNNVIIPENANGEELTHFLAGNPTIAHSWTYRWPAISTHLCPNDLVKPLAPSYANVSELPGKPFWHWLNDPVYLLLYVKKYGVNNLLRWRVSEDRKTIYILGSSMEYHFVKPQDLPHGYLDELCNMVEAGGSVGTKWVRRNLENAFLIGYVTERGSLVANSSLKQPRSEYIDAVSNQSGINLRHYLERGYTSVRPEYRGMGIGTKLLEGLTKRIGNRKLFSIIAEDNIATKKMALRNRTKKVAQFYSDRAGKEIGVWIPEWMIDDTSIQ